MKKFVFGIFTAAMVLAGTAAAQSLKPEEIIGKHLDAIGKKEARDQVTSLIAGGASEFTSKLPNIKGGGKALVVSNADNLYFLMSLNSKEYPFEKIGFFDGQMSLPYVTAGARSPLGAFLADHSRVLSLSLFTGSMSLRWAMRKPDFGGGQMTSAGTKKIDGRKVYAIDYFPQRTGSSEFKIKLYFDAETFHHMRTEYRTHINPKQDTFGQLGRQAGVRLDLTEDFSDHKTVDGLTLPHKYKVSFLTESNSGVFEYSWGIVVTQYYINQKLAPDFFTFDVK